MLRWIQIGFCIAAGGVLIADAVMLAFGILGDRTAGLWWLINFPSIPWLICCMPGPPMGEARIGLWDYLAVFVSVATSCASWGLIGGVIAWTIGPPTKRP